MTLIKQIQDLYGFEPSDDSIKKLQIWHKLFVEYNEKVNLMGKNDIPLLYEKHVLDSLSISMFKPFLNSKILLDVGTGGGFPSLILSIFYPELKIYALDSVNKKINFLKLTKAELGLDNLIPETARAEDYPCVNADILTSRAVGKISLVWKYSKKHLKKGGYFISYKALTAEDEAKEFKKENLEFPEPQIITYNLPLKENFTRKLVIFHRT